MQETGGIPGQGAALQRLHAAHGRVLVQARDNRKGRQEYIKIDKKPI